MPLPWHILQPNHFQCILNWLATPANDDQYPWSSTHHLSTDSTHAVVTEIMPTHFGAVIADLYSFFEAYTYVFVRIYRDLENDVLCTVSWKLILTSQIRDWRGCT
jgi:hypothetical protein